jgi:hypothetical protein
LGDSPFGLYRLARTRDELDAAAARPLSGSWRDEFALIYREAAQIARLGPREVDALEVWECAAVLGRNEAEAREAWPEDAPDIRILRRHLALSEGRDVPGRDEPITDDEYARLLAEAKAGKRKAVM